MRDKNGSCKHFSVNANVWDMLYDDERGRMWKCRECGKNWGYGP